MSTKNKYRMFLRGTVFWIQDNETGKQETLRTKDRTEAERLFNSKNEAHRHPTFRFVSPDWRRGETSKEK